MRSCKRPLGAIVVVAVLLAGCGGSSTSDADRQAARSLLNSARGNLAASLATGGAISDMQVATTQYLTDATTAAEVLGNEEVARELAKDVPGVRSFCVPCADAIEQKITELRGD
jgi:hypothetical protein